MFRRTATFDTADPLPAACDPAPHPHARTCLIAVGLFAVLSLYCGIRSEGFIAADACTHYLAARYAWQNPINFVDVWNRPLVTSLYAGPAWLGGREAVRILCMLIALGCGIVSLAIACGPDVSAEVVRYINRLSDLLFILSRGANAGDEPLWEPGRFR